MILRRGKNKEDIFFSNKDCGFTFHSEKKKLVHIHGNDENIKKWVVSCIKEDIFELPLTIIIKNDNDITKVYRGKFLQQFLYTNVECTKERKKTLSEIIKDSIKVKD